MPVVVPFCCPNGKNALLQITMSMAVTMALVELVRRAVYCTEPFRLPYAGRATICAFDKTGTLTSDTMRVLTVLGTSPAAVAAAARDKDLMSQIAGPTGTTPIEESSTGRLPRATVTVLAGCHSLAPLGGESGSLAGDPVDKAAVSAVGWSVKSRRFQRELLHASGRSGSRHLPTWDRAAHDRPTVGGHR